jgi:hypothetical protein
VPDPATGEIVVTDYSSTAPRVYDAQGNWLRTLGRRGRGPGEFERPATVFVLGDSVLAVSDNYQAAIFDRNSALVRAFPITLTDGVAFPVGRTPTGWFIWTWASGSLQRPVAGQVRQDSIEIRHGARLETSPDMTLSSTRDAPLVARFPRGGQISMIEVNGRISGVPFLWDAQPSYGADRRGLFYLSLGNEYRIDVFNATGNVVRSIRRDVLPVPITDAMFSEYERRAITFLDTAQIPQDAAAAMRRSALAALNLTRNVFVPVLGRLLVAHDGGFWVERPDKVDDQIAFVVRVYRTPQPTLWDRYDVEGRLIGSVWLPAAFTARAIAGNAVYGILRDELDIEFVARYVVER